MRQKVPDFTGPLSRQPLQYVLEISALVVIDGHSPIVQVARKHYPAFQAAIEGFGCG